MPLRNSAINYLKNIQNISEYDIYEFGINHGKSFYDINTYLERANIKPNKIWGFDSFVGLPKEKDGLPIINGWEEGYFNVKEEMSVENTDDVISNILSKNNSGIPCEFIAGFFCDTLTNELVVNKNMKKASFIDIDVDLYQSTIEIFDWFYDNDLMSDTVIVNFDDWGGVAEYTGGESKAFKDIIDKYKLNTEEIFTTHRVQDSNGIFHVQKVFKISK